MVETEQQNQARIQIKQQKDDEKATRKVEKTRHEYYRSREMSWDKTKTTMRKVFLLPVKAYQKLISPMLGANCIYSPTCSEYFKQAVVRHGIVKGTILGTSRILRCNRFYMGGPDPVPDRFSFKYIRDRRIAFRRHRH